MAILLKRRAILFGMCPSLPPHAWVGIKRTYDRVLAETRKSQASFKLLKSHPMLCRGCDSNTNNLKPPEPEIFSC